MTIAGEQDVPLENKQSVEFLKGIAGVESGVAAAGGLIDYVTKRPPRSKTSTWPPIIAVLRMEPSTSAICSVAASRWARASISPAKEYRPT